ncbi:hypothetical protein BKA66DRAFT_438622 [Pyrenochaeta sp. MPI-SDFR-AT-0127]|nr:hypothetical protein BKA66DRAFT_438622 [Pyrenochaeta sp. MPI-SDFR-AT-0127]
MFRWYKNATKCYVFLLDVSISAATGTPQRSAWEPSFRVSEWFTRGWTLQELIALASVEFFSREGWRIGDKASVEQLVHEITDIPLKALRNCPLDQFTISERIEWARNRRTTEEEDSVYCLLGILDIFISTAYGEGKRNASRRLQIELEAASSAPSIIPFSRNDHFVGRESQLAELEVKLFGGEQTITLAILEVSGWDDEKADIKQLVKVHLSRKGARPCLLIFDNIEDVNLGSSGLFTAPAANLIDYLPQPELCSIVFTTTNSVTANRLASHGTVELGEMTPDAAQRMLENYLDTKIARSEQEATLLLQELSYLPLAIVQAAAYINTRNVTLQEYQSQLTRQKQEVLKRDGELSEDKLQEYGRTGPVTTTLLISIDQIRRSDALAADYLFLTACVDRKDIPLDLLEASSARERDDAIKVLSNYALITRRPAESALDLHRLVHRALWEWLQKQNWLSKWTQNAIKQLLKVFPDHDYSSRSKWRRLLPHAKYALSHSLAKEENEDKLMLTWKCAMTLLRDGRYNESEKLFLQVMETLKRVCGDKHPNTLISITSLATTYWNQGRWKEAEELDVQVIETFKRVLGDEHPNTLASMANLASTYRSQGRWKEAEELEVQVMETFKRVLGDEHLDTLISMGNLATTYWNQGRWKEAEELVMQVMETRQRVLGNEHPDTLASINSLAFMFKGASFPKLSNSLIEDCYKLQR